MKAAEGPSRLRLGAVFVCFLVFYVLVGLRLVRLQIFGNRELGDLARRQFSRSEKTSYYRLPIFDRNGEELAVSIPSSSAFARPRMIRARVHTARTLARILGGTTKGWLARLRPDRSFVWLQRQMDPATTRKLAAEHLEGVFFEPENKRVYPNGSLAAHVIGFTDIDGNGLSGVELSLNKDLLAAAGSTEGLRDGRGQTSYIARTRPREEEKGGVFLTIDRRIQHVVEEELEAALASTGGKAAMGIVMDPFTGEILAMGQRPTFDPNAVSRAAAANLTNRLVSHRFEPGSTIKVVFAAQSIQDGVLSPNSPIDCEQGEIVFGKVTFREAESHHKYGIIPLHRVIRHSSNVGAVKVARALGADRMRLALNRFGLSGRTGIELPGEVSASLKRDDYWRKPVNLAAAGFGQGIAVTPLQMTASFLPFANGGFWVKPRLLLEESVPKRDNSRHEIRRVLSLSTVEKMREMLTAVTEAEGGTGHEARIAGVRVAGKTGTAQKFVDGTYTGGNYFASFIGYAPADRPQFLVGVMVDEPRKPYYASKVAAPLFRRIAERSLQILGKTPRKTVAARTDPEAAVAVLPEAPVPTIQAEDGKWIMPDLTGVSLREALSVVGSHVSRIHIRGSGYLTGQSPEPGTVITPGTSVRLNFSPDPHRPDAG